MNSSAKVLPLPPLRFYNIDYRVWVWLAVGTFLVVLVHVCFFSGEHFKDVERRNH
jgi:heme exporter protein D